MKSSCSKELADAERIQNGLGVKILNCSPHNIHRSGRERMYWNSIRDGTLNIGRNKMKREVRAAGFKSLKQAYRQTNGALFT